MNSSHITPKRVKKKNAENANINAKAKSKPSLKQETHSFSRHKKISADWTIMKTEGKKLA